MDERWWEHEPPGAAPAPPLTSAPPATSRAGPPSARPSGSPGSQGSGEAPTGRSRGGLPLALAGIAIVVTCVVGAAVAWSIADGRHDDTIAAFARAPAGCDTTLSFEREGRFVIYVETAGRVDRVDGDCDVAGAYDRGGGAMPPFELVVLDVDGEQVAIAGHSRVAYESDGYVGLSVGSVRIDGPGDYVVRVASPADDFVVAIGTDPDDDAAVLRTLALGTLIGGLVVGGTMLVLAARRRREPVAVHAVWADAPAAGMTGTWREPARPPTTRAPVPGEALHLPSPPDPPASPAMREPESGEQTAWAPPTHRDG